jgi:hypothetical protein
MITPHKRLLRLLIPFLGLAMASTVLSAPAASASTTVPLTDCAVSDNGKPVVSAFQLGAHSADVRTGEARIPVTAVVDDTGGPGPATGVQRVLVTLSVAGGLDRQNGYVPQLLTPAGDGRTWQGTLTVPPGVEPGQWSAELTVADNAYAEVVLGPDELRAMGSDSEVTVQSSAIDETPPALRGLTVSRKKVDTRKSSRRVTVTVRAGDVGSGLAEVVVFAHDDVGHGAASAVLRLVSGTRTSGTWRASMAIPRWAGNSSWKLAVFLRDRLNRGNRVSSVDLRHRGQVSALTVRSRSDRTFPRFSDLRVSPKTIDVRNADGVLRVSARVTDTGSGIASSGVIAGDGKLHRVSGNRHAGRYTGKIVVKRCSTQEGLRPRSGSESIRIPFHTNDRASHYTDSRSPRPPVSATFRDNDWPGVGGILRPSGHVEVIFQEDVVANGSWNPRVAARGSAAELTGSWICASASGATVSCDADPFRTADFTPALPLSPSTEYYVAVNREHTLHVVDLAGNPVVRSALIVMPAS